MPTFISSNKRKDNAAAMCAADTAGAFLQFSIGLNEGWAIDQITLQFKAPFNAIGDFRFPRN